LYSFVHIVETTHNNNYNSTLSSALSLLLQLTSLLIYSSVDAAAIAYAKQHGRGQLGDWKRGNVNHCIARIGCFSLTII